MNNFAVGRERNRAGAIDGSPHIVAGDLAQPIAETDAALAVDSADVRASDTDNTILDDGVGSLFGFGRGLVEDPAGRLKITDNAPACSRGIDHAMGAVAEGPIMQFRNQDTNFRAAGVEHGQ